MSSSSAGGDRPGRVDAGRYLERRSAIVKQIQAIGRPVRVVLVDDNDFDARRIETSLRILLGSSLLVQLTRTSEGLVRLIKRGFDPDAVVIDDRLPPAGTAETTLAAVRAAGFAGPVIVISGQFSQGRQQALQRLAVAGVFDKDDVDALGLAELFLPPSSRPPES